MKQKAWTKDGEIEIEVVTLKEILQSDISKATTIEQRLVAIEKYLGVVK